MRELEGTESAELLDEVTHVVIDEELVASSICDVQIHCSVPIHITKGSTIRQLIATAADRRAVGLLVKVALLVVDEEVVAASCVGNIQVKPTVPIHISCGNMLPHPTHSTAPSLRIVDRGATCLLNEAPLPIVEEQLITPIIS